MITNADANMATEKECIQFLETYLSSESAFVCSSRYSGNPFAKFILPFLNCTKFVKLSANSAFSATRHVYFLTFKKKPVALLERYSKHDMY